MFLSFLKVAWAIAKWFVIPIVALFALIGALLSAYLGAGFAKGSRRQASGHQICLCSFPVSG